MDEIKSTVDTVIRRIGVISPRTKAQIREELLTHFEDALESTRSLPESRKKRQRLLLERFGDPQRIADYFRDIYSHERIFLSALRIVLTVSLLALTSVGVIFLLKELVQLLSAHVILSSTEAVRIQWASFFTFFLGLFYAFSYELAKVFKSHSKLKSHLLVGLMFLLLGSALDLLVRQSHLPVVSSDFRNLRHFLENASATLVYFKIYFFVVASTAATMDLVFRRELEFSKQTLLFLICGLPAGFLLNLLNRISIGDNLHLASVEDLFLWVAIIAAICVFGSFTRFFVPFFERKYLRLLGA